MKSPGIKTGPSKYGTQGKKQSINSQISVEVPATPTVPIDNHSPSFDPNKFMEADDDDDAENVFDAQDEEDAPPSLPPPPILPKQPVAQQLDQPPLIVPPSAPPPLNKKQSFKQIPIQAIPEMMPIEEEELENPEQNKVVEPQLPAPVLPPRRSVSKAHDMRRRAESAPALPPRKTPLAPRISEGSVVNSASENHRPPELPPRRSKK